VEQIAGQNKRIKLIVAYDGTDYCGWQIQPSGITIEEVLNLELSTLLGEEIRVTGASRTDSGVHSLGNVAVFDTKTRIPADKLCYALNQRLPEDIVVQSSCEVARDFHPRRCYSEKTYEYRILNRKIPLPTLRRYTYFYYRELDVAHMQQAASFLVGKHDFKSFCSAKTAVEDTVRTILSCTVERTPQDVIVIRVTGTGFLYNMVRIIAGTLIQVGIGELEPQDIEIILAKRERGAAGPTAPAHGLTMIGIAYEGGKGGSL
jgi:tRNA pseudouridine38-40 synthase